MELIIKGFYKQIIKGGFYSTLMNSSFFVFTMLVFRSLQEGVEAFLLSCYEHSCSNHIAAKQLLLSIIPFFSIRFYSFSFLVFFEKKVNFSMARYLFCASKVFQDQAKSQIHGFFFTISTGVSKLVPNICIFEIELRILP